MLRVLAILNTPPEVTGRCILLLNECASETQQLDMAQHSTAGREFHHAGRSLPAS